MRSKGTESIQKPFFFFFLKDACSGTQLSRVRENYLKV